MKIAHGIISEEKEMVIYYGDPWADVTLVILATLTPVQNICLLPSGAVKRMLYFVNSSTETVSNIVSDLVLLQNSHVSNQGNQ